ncbi:MAG: serine--tRNA ligase [Acidobacteriota bacterium]
MIDLKKLRADPAAFREALGRKRYRGEDLDRVIETDRKVRALRAEIEALRAQRNAASREIPQATREQKHTLLSQVKQVGDQLKAKEPELRAMEEELRQPLLLIPNPPDATAPDGAAAESNVVVRHVREPARFGFQPRDHLEIGELRDWIDVKRAARTSGSRFAYLKGDLVDLQLALIGFGLQVLKRHGFVAVIPPVLVREAAMYGTGFFPAERNEIYKIDGEDSYLVGTSEVPLAALHMNEILDTAKLPLRYAGWSTCFRKEAGTYGKDTRGIFRVHQFDKLEMFSFCDPALSGDEHESLLAVEEEILDGLELPYRVVNICAGDLGAPAAKKYDLEAWMPGQKAYREITSCSNCTDFQARRLGIRLRLRAGSGFVHTLNGTAVAIGRTVIAVLENHQQQDGTIRVPAALRPYLAGRPAL